MVFNKNNKPNKLSIGEIIKYGVQYYMQNKHNIKCETSKWFVMDAIADMVAEYASERGTTGHDLLIKSIEKSIEANA